MPRANTTYFTSDLFQFLRELKVHNDREWFTTHKARYLSVVEEPMLRFIADLDPRLSRIDRSIHVDPRRTGGSMFRFYRDTRFSKDKRPYKTSTGAHFRHRAVQKGESAPGFYLSLAPGESVGGGGIYHPDAPALKRIRDRIVEAPSAWARVRKTTNVVGDSLKRPPAGYDPEHRFIEDLKRKDFYDLETFSEAEVCSPRFMDRYLAACSRLVPLLTFLNGALGLK
jgi:uncharacterized protein (TIGR02453 family)